MSRMFHAFAGWRCLTVRGDFTPFEWHLALSFFRKPCTKVAIGLGPFCLAIYFTKTRFISGIIRESS